MNICRWIRRQTRSSVYPTDRYSIARQTATQQRCIVAEQWNQCIYTCTMERETRKKDEFTEKKGEANERKWENW